MQSVFELVNRHQPWRDARGLRYAPDSDGCQYRLTRQYRIAFDGDPDAVRAFVREVLQDEVSDSLCENQAAALEPYRYIVDITLRPGCLDLEKEAVRRAIQDRNDSAWSLQELDVAHRVYLRGEQTIDADSYVRDMVNPVIHTWRLHDRAAM